jgi:hypothetical protein
MWESWRAESCSDAPASGARFASNSREASGVDVP